MCCRRIKVEKEEVREPEADDERIKRTVFAYQCSFWFPIIIISKVSSNKGCRKESSFPQSSLLFNVYIEFYDVMSVPVAIALSGQSLLGHSVMVKPSEAEKNLFQSTTTELYISNLHVNIKEDQLHEVFEPFGKIELVQLPLDRETRQRKGYGFVQFARHEDARAALSLDGQLEIAGHVMKSPISYNPSIFIKEFGCGSSDGKYVYTWKVSATADHTNGQEVVASAGDFDDDRSDGMGVAGSVGAAPAISPPFVPIGQIPIPVPAGFPTSTFSIPDALPLSYTIGNPSECLLLKNMFDPKLEPEPDFDQDIKDDVKDKCTKFGELKHVYVDKNSAGFVYLRFQQSESALAAQRALHGRWFAGKMITATFLVPENYNTKFPESK
ncbi:hypothetical protein M9H77_33804 [Catharanthus roseus]|uniref:Uncharacterized protein n=1 Tax=Catharanthus roseus TaxID=4058 RepID=A0ACB9ZK94_CATRO|nr:hypothetical protein M9H77_33804 [Catharanthus roseus]